jgi:hypothetical protein
MKRTPWIGRLFDKVGFLWDNTFGGDFGHRFEIAILDVGGDANGL